MPSSTFSGDPVIVMMNKKEILKDSARRVRGHLSRLSFQVQSSQGIEVRTGCHEDMEKRASRLCLREFGFAAMLVPETQHRILYSHDSRHRWHALSLKRFRISIRHTQAHLVPGTSTSDLSRSYHVLRSDSVSGKEKSMLQAGPVYTKNAPYVHRAMQRLRYYGT